MGDASMKQSLPVTLAHAGLDLASDVAPLMKRLQGDNEPFVLATVVRTISVTAAKAGAKAVVDRDGSIVAGWIGGGCARAAVVRAAKAAFDDGETRLISIQPGELLAELGVEPGDEREGVQFARNMCPSQGTMDIFIEPVLPRPNLVVYGASPVAVALALQARTIGFDIAVCAPPEDLEAFPAAVNRIGGFDGGIQSNGETYIVVSTQGRGDLAALEETFKVPARHIGFVGSRRKLEALKAKLRDKGGAPADLDRVKGPAGLDLGAITPEEIALSILAELLMLRRKNQRRHAEPEV
ncbi:xanthine dehydrogenase accessory factor [Roseibium marinum]|uniref:Xanthine dehydrogenase accessory factor n=2 Tax=Roseibium marinum TaxID=281252 RepID=A0A2S3UQM2_9HYPH|nr:xanthine dehydrogenase accessory factor [Roseibium marinum]